ncbi:MAG: type VI secretion system ATPase TssH, partial [Sphingobacteriaceae bacterium]|nr:type VI secretion system ATPase TssH [Sphingobacteriaceae bacterium]
QVLDDGRLTDNKGRTVNFKNTIVIMTSNIGSHLIQDNFDKLDEFNKEEVLAKTKSEVFELLKKTIRPEFLNRIDEVIMFEPLNRDDVNDIVKIQFKQIADRLAEQHMMISATDEAIDWLAQLGYDPHYGARPVKRVMQKQILNELSKQILADAVNKDKEIVVDVIDKKFVFLNK